MGAPEAFHGGVAGDNGYQIRLIDNWVVAVPRHVPRVHAHRELGFENGESQPATPQGTFSNSASVHESSRSRVASRTAFTVSGFTGGAECPHSCRM